MLTPPGSTRRSQHYPSPKRQGEEIVFQNQRGLKPGGGFCQEGLPTRAVPRKEASLCQNHVYQERMAVMVHCKSLGFSPPTFGLPRLNPTGGRRVRAPAWRRLRVSSQARAVRERWRVELGPGRRIDPLWGEHKRCFLSVETWPFLISGFKRPTKR